MLGRMKVRTLANAETIYALLREGQTRATARKVSGISEDTFTRWMRDPCDDFSEGVEKAEAVAVQARYLQLAKHFDDSWQAVAWWLERRGGEDYRKIDRQEITGKDGADLFATYTALSTEDLTARIAAHVAALAALTPDSEAD